ncbi:MAG: hypothetical protein ACRDP8_04710 [Actinopolymorphaceae bacterium]
MADPAEQIGSFVGADAGGGDELVAGCLQGGGEAGPVRVGAGAGFDRVDHRHPQ